MASFNQDFLRRQANRDDPGAVLQRQTSAMKQIAESYVRMQRLDEVADEIGDLDYRVVAENGVVRMIMSAISLEEEFGVNANLAGFDENGVVQFYVDADDGTIVAGGGNVIIGAAGVAMANSTTSWFRFEDAAGNYDTITIAADPNNDFEFTNLARSPNGMFSFFIKDTAGNIRMPLRILENSTYANVLNVHMDVPAAGSLFNMGGDVQIWAGADGKITWFNAQSRNIDFIVSDDFGGLPIWVDASDELLSLYGNVNISATQTDFYGGALFIDDGTPTVSFYGDHFVITSGDGVVINEAGSDLDTRIEGNTDANLTIWDAGLDAVGIGGAAESGYKVKVTGDVKFTGKLDGPIAAETNGNVICSVSSPGGASAFAGTIATLPGGATLTYGVTSGQEGSMKPTGTTQLAKMRLYNTTRGTSALISDCTTGTNTLTLTANVPAGWQVGDVITIASQTVSGGGYGWVDMEIVSGPTGRSALYLNFLITSGAAGDETVLHPTTTYGGSRRAQLPAYVAGVQSSGFGLVPITSNVFSWAWTANSTVITVREAGYIA